MYNNINVFKTNNISNSILHKKIYLKYHQKNDIDKNNDKLLIKSLIQVMIKKDLGNLISLNRTWLCIKIKIIDDEDDETTEFTDNLIKLFKLPDNIGSEVEKYLQKYDKYLETVTDIKDEFLLDLTSYIINNQEEKLEEEKNLNTFLHSIKIEMQQKFNINIYIGKANNILLSTLACLKCFVESTKNKNNDSIVINDINDILNDIDKNDYLCTVNNNEKSILSFINNFPFEYLSMDENIYITNFLNKKINEKNFPDIKNIGDIINNYLEQIYNIYQKDDIYKEIFSFCLGIGEPFHKSQIITYESLNPKEIKEKYFKDKSKSQIIGIYKKLADELFKQIYFYQYIPKTLVIIMKDNKNKTYKRITDKTSLFYNKDSLVNVGEEVIKKIIGEVPENGAKNFIYMKVYFDNIVKMDNIKKEIWENIYNDDITEVRIKNSKLCYWNNFLNSKNKNKSKSFDESIKNSKKNMMNKKNSFSSKSINDINKMSKKVSLDLLKFNKKRKKPSKHAQYLLLAQNKKMENFGVRISKEIKK